MGKLALIRNLNLPTVDVVNLLISGIMKNSLRATLITWSTDSLDVFLDRMRQITKGIDDLERKSTDHNRYKPRKNLSKR